jgi:glutamyl-tRNA synthetase
MLSSTSAPRGRFAPSPTGDLHVGTLRTALLAWLQVRRAGGTFVLRIEDLDRERCRPAHVERQLASLRAIGLDWDEGPYVQSERLELYEAALERLRAAGLVYPCYCSRAEVAQAASAPHGPGDDGPRYQGSCRTLSVDDRRVKESTGRKPSWRFRVREGTVSFEDGVRGRISQDVLTEVGDFVVRRADGIFAYQLAVVVDDIAMRMTDVLRGADLAHSTPRQLLLYEALGASPPRFHHVPIVLGPDGEKLSKRHGPVSVGELLESGVAASQLLAELARLSGLEIAAARTAADLLPAVDLRKLPDGDQRWSPKAFT